MVILVEFVGGVNAEFALGDRMTENGECEWPKETGSMKMKMNTNMNMNMKKLKVNGSKSVLI